MEMIVMEKYALIEGRHRESITEVFILRLGSPINIFWMNENHIAAITFQVCMRSWSTSYVITHGMI
jgi:hypothetical protein